MLMALHEIYPDAPIYTIFCKKGSSAGRAFGPSFAKASSGAKAMADMSAGKDVRVVESWFGRLPFCDKLISPFRFLIPLIWESFDFSQYDLVISSASWAITKGFTGDRIRGGVKGEDRGRIKGKPKEICYCHTPPRYLYGYETSRNWKKHWYFRLYALIVNHFMRMYDFNRAQKVSFFIANSREVARRIEKFYRRNAVVINPPVDIVNKFKVQSLKFKVNKEGYYLTGGRLEAAKNFDLIIRACNKINIPLKVYGTGSQEGFLRSIAGKTVEFLGRVSEEEKNNLLKNCEAFIAAAADEDFGITPVEAMAAGRPVVAFKGGGYTETIVEGKTGVFFNDLTIEGVIGGIRETLLRSDIHRSFGGQVGGRGGGFKPEDCRKQATKFSKERFKKEIEEFVKKNV